MENSLQKLTHVTFLVTATSHPQIHKNNQAIQWIQYFVLPV